MTYMVRVTRLMLAQTYVRYGLASAVALLCDVPIFLLSLRAGLTPAIAAVIGYCAGIFIHWLMSSRLVFTLSPDRLGAAAHRRKAMFIASALFGLAITTAIIAIANVAGMLPIIGKLIAIAISFHTTYSLRRMVVFA